MIKSPGTGRGATVLLVLASIAVAFAAADTYVVVLALPDMMATAKIPINQLQQAAPIVSGFLLGYVAMLPLMGRIADLRGRVPVLTMALGIFAVGSLVTAVAYDLPSMVTGRFLQGVGGGGLVPATLALVADIYPAERRGIPLGIVSGVQELGSVVGPLLGAVVLAFATWQFIFVINLVVGVILALAIRAAAGQQSAATDREPDGRAFPDPIGILALLIALVAAALVVARPSSLLRDLTWGQLFIPYTGDGRWLTPIGIVAMGAAVVLILRCVYARRPLVDVRTWFGHLREADLVGASLLAVFLGGIILAFATADPEVQVFSAQGPWFLVGSAIAAIAFVVHIRRADAPLIPHGAVRRVPAWGSLLVSFFIGAALIAALIDIPIFARTTIYRDSQLDAALVLVRFLVALPVGAVLGGYLMRRFSSGMITAVGMFAAAGGFGLMTQWDENALRHWSVTLTLLLTGFGFGLALAPVNAALLASTDDAVHGVAAALVVVARMVGMLVGISALTTIGLRRFFAANVACLEERGNEYGYCGTQAALAQEHTVFLGAAVCAIAAAVLALILFRSADTHGMKTGELLRSAG